jgi:hypothetical protein
VDISPTMMHAGGVKPVECIICGTNVFYQCLKQCSDLDKVLAR